MKSISLVAFNARYSHSCLALYYLRNTAREAGWDARVIEFSLRADPADAALRVAAGRPDAVGLSVYIWNAGLVRVFAAALRECLPGVTIILGGPEAGYSPEDWLDALPAVDRVVAGPGEAALHALLSGGTGPGRGVVRAANPPFSRIPFPYEDGDFRGLDRRYVYYESSRGCAFRCQYCLSSRDDQRPQFREVPVVLGELERIMAHSPGTVKFVDRSYNLDPRRARQIWQGIMDRFSGAGTRFHFEVHPSLLGEEDFTVLEKAPPGLFQFEIGVQSLNERALEAVGRAQDWNGVRTRIARLVSAGRVRTHVDLLMGLPFEDMPSARHAVEELCLLGADHLQVGFLKVLPGTTLAARAGELGITHDPGPPYRVRRTPWLDAGEMDILEGISRMIDLFVNGAPFPLTMKEIAAECGGAFAMLSEMAGAFHGRELTADRSLLAGALLNWIDRKFPERKDYLLDCLRWDWARARPFRGYPAALRPAEGADWKKRSARALAREDAPCRLSGEELKAAAVFRPVSGDFRDRHLGGRDTAVLLPDGRVITLDID